MGLSPLEAAPDATGHVLTPYIFIFIYEMVLQSQPERIYGNVFHFLHKVCVSVYFAMLTRVAFSKYVGTKCENDAANLREFLASFI